MGAIHELHLPSDSLYSDVILDDQGWDEDGLVWDVSDMKNDFGLEFDAWEKIREHLDYYIQLES